MINNADNFAAFDFSVGYWVLAIACIAASAGVWFYYRYRSSSHVRIAQENVLIAALLDIEESAVLANKHGYVEFINPSAEQLFRQKVRSARGKYHSDLFHLLDRIKHTPINWLDSGRLGQQLSFQDCLLNCVGLQDLETTYLVRPFALDGKNTDHFLLLLKDQAEVRALQAHLNYLRTNDQQTKLLNRKSFELKLKQALDEVMHNGVKHAFCHVALDQFKVVNDTLGHSAGDSFIEHISSLLRDSIDKKRDVLARIGGDEFGILFRETEPVAALRKAEEVRNKLVRHAFIWNGSEHRITASIGFVPLHRESGTPNRVLSIADAACRVAKDKGGNRLHLYRPDDAAINKHRGQLVWVSRLRKAFEGGQFHLYAQPIHNLEPREYLKHFSHYEILLRLFDEKGQPVSPDEFIPAAEYYSMMPKVDRWVVRELLMQIKALARRPNCPVFSINLSGQSLDDSKFLPYVLEAIRRSGVPPSVLCFEITERVAISNLELARKFIDTLKLLGCDFSLDDFGTGVSSFGYLKELPVDYLKIDGSFIKDIATDEVGRAMVQSINQIGQLMAVKTIAEYVENDQIIAILREIGIDYGQGYGISKPIPLPAVIEKHMNMEPGH